MELEAFGNIFENREMRGTRQDLRADPNHVPYQMRSLLK